MPYIPKVPSFFFDRYFLFSEESVPPEDFEKLCYDICCYGLEGTKLESKDTWLQPFLDEVKKDIDLSKLTKSDDDSNDDADDGGHNGGSGDDNDGEDDGGDDYYHGIFEVKYNETALIYLEEFEDFRDKK